MFTTILALGCRILSNPLANMVQKQLVQSKSALWVNLYSYLILSLFCIVSIFILANGSISEILTNWSGFSLNFWAYVALAGFLCTLGSICLIKALEIGDMSVLGPINSYKCVVGLVLGILLLGEIPSVRAFIGVLFIIFGSWFIFDTVENGFKPSLLLRKDILLRFCALLCTGCEAVILKKIILLSSIWQSFVLWCFSGLLFSVILILLFKKKYKPLNLKEVGKCLVIASSLGVMQFSTNFVFKRMDVGLALALFQLSSIVAVVMGYKIFNEKQILKKLLGSAIMILGSCFILLV